MDLSVDTVHLRDTMIHFGSEGSALTVSAFLLSPNDNDKEPPFDEIYNTEFITLYTYYW